MLQNVLHVMAQEESIGESYPRCHGTGRLDSHSAGEIVSEGDSFIDIGESKESPITLERMQDLSSTIYNILLITGIIIAFAIGGILGIKFLTGGIEGQVEVKKALVPYIVGCIIVFGAFTIWKVVLLVLQ